MTRWSCLALSLLVVGCSADQIDPFNRPETWHARRDNDANLRAMVVDPHDLGQGRGEVDGRSVAAAAPVERLDSGNRTPLIVTNTSSVGAGSEPAAAQPQGASPSAP